MEQSWQCKTFRSGEVIAEEGKSSPASFVIEEGIVHCYNYTFGDDPIGTLRTGDAFGYEDILVETYIAASALKCLFLLRNGSDINFMNDSTAKTNMNTEMMKDATIEDFEPIRVIGTGNFSTVQLANFCPNKDADADADADRDETLYAIKCFNNSSYKENTWKTSIENEINVLSQLDNPFIVRFFRTIICADNFYLIQEALLGGDLYQLLVENSKFSEDTTKFYAASVLQAFTSIHSNNIVYRDLKLENLIMTDQGYIKLIDFGISKKLDAGEKTFTSCGTLDYVAPEIILKTGHDMSVDYWALGIIIFEMISGDCPFVDDSKVKTFKNILSGKINFPSYFSPALCKIINALLQIDPSNRLGHDYHDNCSSVKTHQWFEGYDWTNLIQQNLIAPCIPDIDNHEKIKDMGSSSKRRNEGNQLSNSFSNLSNSFKAMFGNNKSEVAY